MIFCIFVNVGNNTYNPSSDCEISVGVHLSFSAIVYILRNSVCKLWMKQQIHINTYFTVTGWVLCVIPHICKDEKDHSDIDHRKQVINVIKTLFHGVPEDEMDVTQDIFVLSTLNLIIIMVHLMRMNLYGKVKASDMVTVICGIKNIHFLVPRLLVFLHVYSHQSFWNWCRRAFLG